MSWVYCKKAYDTLTWEVWGEEEFYLFCYLHLRTDAVVPKFDVVQRAQCSTQECWGGYLILLINSQFQLFKIPRTAHFGFLTPHLASPKKKQNKRNPSSGYLKELPSHNHERTGVLFTVIWRISIYIYEGRLLVLFICPVKISGIVVISLPHSCYHWKALMSKECTELVS
jgi:hypothetical protein